MLPSSLLLQLVRKGRRRYSLLGYQDIVQPTVIGVLGDNNTNHQDQQHRYTLLPRQHLRLQEKFLLDLIQESKQIHPLRRADLDILLEKPRGLNSCMNVCWNLSMRSDT